MMITGMSIKRISIHAHSRLYGLWNIFNPIMSLLFVSLSTLKYSNNVNQNKFSLIQSNGNYMQIKVRGYYVCVFVHKTKSAQKEINIDKVL